MVVPLMQKQIWIDEATKSDTIVTGEGYSLPNYLYYAARNWQSSVDTNITHGFRNIGIRYGDSILVKPLVIFQPIMMAHSFSILMKTKQF
jgi:hypothetical protein